MVHGATKSGFDKKKLMWFYADCARYFKMSDRDENIKYLIHQSAKQKHTIKTVIKENLNTQRREERSKGKLR